MYGRDVCPHGFSTDRTVNAGGKYCGRINFQPACEVSGIEGSLERIFFEKGGGGGGS